MRGAYLKLFIIRKLSEKPMSGYELMKEFEKVAGRKPSSGSVYPILKNLCEKGIVRQINRDGDKLYEITNKGLDVVNEMENIKQDLLMKLREHVLTVAHILGDTELLKDLEYFEEIWGLSKGNRKIRRSFSRLGHAVASLIEMGADPDGICVILDEAVRKLEEMEEKISISKGKMRKN